MAQQGPSRPLRPIAPRMVPEPPPPGPPSEEGKIKRASAACGECKRRRTKCSADTTGSPCTECALHRRECIIDEFADKRRKVAAKRAQEDLKYYRGFLEQLLEAIRTGDGMTVDAIINIIRSGAPHEDILALVTQALKQAPKAVKRKAPDMVDGTTSSSAADMSDQTQTPDGWT